MIPSDKYARLYRQTTQALMDERERKRAIAAIESMPDKSDRKRQHQQEQREGRG